MADLEWQENNPGPWGALGSRVLDDVMLFEDYDPPLNKALTFDASSDMDQMPPDGLYRLFLKVNTPKLNEVHLMHCEDEEEVPLSPEDQAIGRKWMSRLFKARQLEDRQLVRASIDPTLSTYQFRHFLNFCQVAGVEHISLGLWDERFPTKTSMKYFHAMLVGDESRMKTLDLHCWNESELQMFMKGLDTLTQPSPVWNSLVLRDGNQTYRQTLETKKEHLIREHCQPAFKATLQVLEDGKIGGNVTALTFYEYFIHTQGLTLLREFLEREIKRIYAIQFSYVDFYDRCAVTKKEVTLPWHDPSKEKDPFTEIKSACGLDVKVLCYGQTEWKPVDVTNLGDHLLFIPFTFDWWNINDAAAQWECQLKFMNCEAAKHKKTDAGDRNVQKEVEDLYKAYIEEYIIPKLIVPMTRAWLPPLNVMFSGRKRKWSEVY